MDKVTGCWKGHDDPQGKGHEKYPHISIRHLDGKKSAYWYYRKIDMLNLTNLQTKGYDELIEIDGEVVYQVFAIKKSNGIYITYYYTVPQNKLDQAEDYEIEEFDEFKEFELAIRHIQSKGANLSRFNVFKGNKPL